MSRSFPESVPGLTGVRQVSTNGVDTVAVLANGTAVGWGLNETGAVGNGTTQPQLTPVTVPGLTGAASVSVGSAHALALLRDGTVEAWGDNSDGELGDGTVSDHLSPKSVPGLTGVTKVAAGSGFSLALLTDDTVRSWGSNRIGQLGIGTTGLGPNGITDAANVSTPTAVSRLAGATDIAAGDAQSAAVAHLPAFTAMAGSGSGTVAAGGSTTTTATLAPINGYSGHALLSVSGLPSGVTASFGASTVSPGTPVTITLQTSVASLRGSATITFTATDGNLLVPSSSVRYVLTIGAPADFGITPTDEFPGMTSGGTVTTDLQVSPLNGYTEPVTLSIKDLPPGLTAAFAPAVVAPGGTATLTFTADSDAAAGTYVVTIDGVGKDPLSPVVHQTTLELTITDGSGGPSA